MNMRIKLLKSYMGHEKGKTIEVSRRLGERLVRDRFAQEMPSTKVKSVESTKG